MRDVMRRRHYSIRTERSYCDWVKRFILHFNMKSRDDLSEGEKKIEMYLTFLARDKNVAPSTIPSALSSSAFRRPGQRCILLINRYLLILPILAFSINGYESIPDSRPKMAQLKRLLTKGHLSYPADGASPLLHKGGCPAGSRF